MNAINAQIVLVEVLFIRSKKELAEFALLGRQVRGSGKWFPCSGGGLSPRALLHLLLVLDEEEGDLPDPRKVVPTVGDTVPYPINSILSQLVASPWQTG